jgi:hypothetical protein
MVTANAQEYQHRRVCKCRSNFVTAGTTDNELKLLFYSRIFEDRILEERFQAENCFERPSEPRTCEEAHKTEDQYATYGQNHRLQPVLLAPSLACWSHVWADHRAQKSNP